MFNMSFKMSIILLMPCTTNKVTLIFVFSLYGKLKNDTIF
jgi:hypothetical protein